jgi:hypothetical protein
MNLMKSRVGLIEFLSVLAVVLLLLTSLAISPPASAADTSLGGAASSGPQVFATLAPVDSYEFKVAPLFTRIKVVAHQTEVALAEKRISKKSAQKIHDKGLIAWTLVNAAVSVCKQNNKTGKCTVSQKGADLLLDQATKTLAAIH